MINSVKILGVVGALVFSFTAQAYEPHLELGYQYHEAVFDTANEVVDAENKSGNGYHIGLGVHNLYGENKRHLFGFGIDVDEILEDTLIGLRAVDYAYQLNDRWRLGGFFGAATLDTGLPQNGYYMGANIRYLELVSHLDLVLEFRFASGLARDRRLPSDPVASRSDIFVDVFGLAAAFSWRF